MTIVDLDILGLSIVRLLVDEAGGSLQLIDNEPKGLIARIILPNAYAKERRRV